MWNTDGTVVQQAYLQLKHREEDWNKLLRKDKFTWDYVQDDDGNYRFHAADFNPVLSLLSYASAAMVQI